MDYYNLNLSEHEINIILSALNNIDYDNFDYDIIEVEDIIYLLNHKLTETDEDL